MYIYDCKLMDPLIKVTQYYSIALMYDETVVVDCPLYVVASCAVDLAHV